jgi:hypothetical protein
MNILRRVNHCRLVIFLWARAWSDVALGYGCQWRRCPDRSSTVRTDLGGTTFAVCRDHAARGSEIGYWRR